MGSFNNRNSSKVSLWCITLCYLVNKLCANPAFYSATRERHLVTEYSALGRGNTVRLAELSVLCLKVQAAAEEGRSLDLVLRTTLCAYIFPFTSGSQSFLQLYISEAAKLIRHLGRQWVNRKFLCSAPPVPRAGHWAHYGMKTAIRMHLCRHCEGTRGKTREPLQEISRFPCSSSTCQQ